MPADFFNDSLYVCVPRLSVHELRRWYRRCMAVSSRDLQSLLGVMSMSFFTACFRPVRIYMSSLLNSLRSNPSTRFCALSTNDKSDLSWCCHCLPYYDAFSLIKTTPGCTAHFSYLQTARTAVFEGGTFTLPSGDSSSNITAMTLTSSTFW